MSKQASRRVLWVLVGVLLVTAITVVRQHFHYLGVRRNLTQDRQAVLYTGNPFHLVTFLELRAGDDLLETLRRFKTATEGDEGATWIYAGQVATNGMGSAQLGDVNWSAVVFTQYASRSHYDDAAASTRYRDALAAFQRHYSHGARRSAFDNLLLPQRMLQRRIAVALSGPDSPRPFEPATTVREHHLEMIADLRGSENPSAQPAVVVNLQKVGSPEQQAADARYAAPMTAIMARGGFGPTHAAAAEAVEGSHDFDSILFVVYPSLEFFADMIGSSFYQGIYHDKQLGDTQATVTAPILDRL